MTSTAERKAKAVQLAVGTPMGWYQVAWAAELEPGGVKPLTVFEDDYVLYRTQSGEFRLIEAYCGHMGAHLGYGGTIKDDCIVCPYHGWKWGNTGEVVDIPYSSRINRGRRLRTLPVAVVNELVFAWYHPHDEPPTWDDPMPVLPEAIRPGCYPVYPHAAREQEMTGHPQYVVENQVDGAHLVYVHNWDDNPQLDVYGLDGNSFTSVARGTLRTKRGPVTQRVEITAWGVGILISRHGFDFGKTDSDIPMSSEVTTICTTPSTPGKAVLRMSAWLPRPDGDDGDAPTGHAATMLRAGHREVFEHDWQIWEHMRYAQRPAYAREEGRAFSDVRRWTSQYYVQDDE